MILSLVYAYKSFTKKIEFDWLWMIGCMILDGWVANALVEIAVVL